MDEKTARWYVDRYGEHVSQALTLEVAQLKTGHVVVDVGCGSGHAARLAAALVRPGRVVGIDPSLAMVRIARELTAGHPEGDLVEFHEGSAESIPMEGDAATIALAINSVHHWQDLGRGLAEVLRVLAPGGRLIVSEEHVRGGRFGHGHGPAAKPGFVAGAMGDAGFRDVRVEKHFGETDAILYVVGYKAEAPSSTGDGN
jgi:SAM-dependent methyltransferase